MTHLWDMETHWFHKEDNEFIHSTFPYKSWKDYLECKPYKLWKPYILSSWSWKTLNPNDPKPTKRRDADRAVMDCRSILRKTPSIYDKVDPPDTIDTKEPIDMLQIVFLSPDRFTGFHRVEIVVTKEDEDSIRDWIQRHMPTFWKL